MPGVEPPPSTEIAETVSRALAEDHANADATSTAVVPLEAVASGRIVAKAHGVLAGVCYAQAAWRICAPEGDFEWFLEDGSGVEPGAVVMQCRGNARALLAAERTALNFLQQLSGVASFTSQAVAAAGEIQVLDTRKTVPGLRDAQKAAVLAGGGVNHRRDLEDQLLLKENHFRLSGLSYFATVCLAVENAQGKTVGAEAQDLPQALSALEGGASYIMLDNFPPATLADAISKLRQTYPQAIIEVSGSLTPDSLPLRQGIGINRVSLGALTHSAVALDLSFLFDAPVS
jgi:nicotinate-nucleotide pyrophosphorylase (carboxylating)